MGDSTWTAAVPCSGASSSLASRRATNSGRGRFSPRTSIPIARSTPVARWRQPVPGSRLLTSEGYPITGGTSFIMVLEFTERGPRSRALLVSGQTGDPTSPRFGEQTELYASKRWRDVRFTDEEVRADPALTVTRLRGARTP